MFIFLLILTFNSISDDFTPSEFLLDLRACQVAADLRYLEKELPDKNDWNNYALAVSQRNARLCNDDFTCIAYVSADLHSDMTDAVITEYMQKLPLEYCGDNIPCRQLVRDADAWYHPREETSNMLAIFSNKPEECKDFLGKYNQQPPITEAIPNSLKLRKLSDEESSPTSDDNAPKVESRPLSKKEQQILQKQQERDSANGIIPTKKPKKKKGIFSRFKKNR